jgi:hypothetical protein
MDTVHLKDRIEAISKRMPRIKGKEKVQTVALEFSKENIRKIDELTEQLRLSERANKTLELVRRRDYLELEALRLQARQTPSSDGQFTVPTVNSVGSTDSTSVPNNEDIPSTLVIPTQSAMVVDTTITEVSSRSDPINSSVPTQTMAIHTSSIVQAPIAPRQSLNVPNSNIKINEQPKPGSMNRAGDDISSRKPPEVRRSDRSRSRDRYRPSDRRTPRSRDRRSGSRDPRHTQYGNYYISPSDATPMRSELGSVTRYSRPLPFFPPVQGEDDDHPTHLRTVLVQGNQKFPVTTEKDSEWTWSLSECDIFEQWTRNTGLSGMSTHEQWQLMHRQMPKPTYELMEYIVQTYLHQNSLQSRNLTDLRLQELIVVLKAMAPGSESDNKFSDQKSLATNLRIHTGTIIPMNATATKQMFIKIAKLFDSVPTLATQPEYFAREIKSWCEAFRPTDKSDANASSIYNMFFNQIMFNDRRGLQSLPLHLEKDPTKSLKSRLLDWSIYIESVHNCVSLFGSRMLPKSEIKHDTTTHTRYRQPKPFVSDSSIPKTGIFSDCYRCNKGHANPDNCGFARHPDANNDPNKKWSDTPKGKIWTAQKKFSLDWSNMVQGNTLVPMSLDDRARYGYA